jgi:hypothetical protein
MNVHIFLKLLKEWKEREIRWQGVETLNVKIFLKLLKEWEEREEASQGALFSLFGIMAITQALEQAGTPRKR